MLKAAVRPALLMWVELPGIHRAVPLHCPRSHSTAAPQTAAMIHRSCNIDNLRHTSHVLGVTTMLNLLLLACADAPFVGLLAGLTLMTSP